MRHVIPAVWPCSCVCLAVGARGRAGAGGPAGGVCHLSPWLRWSAWEECAGEYTLPWRQGHEGVQGGLDRQAALCHRDSVVALAALDLGERLLLSGSLDGVVKAWK